jgi:two-component system response regulator
MKHPQDLMRILVLEDNPGDVRLIEEGLRSCQIQHKMHVVEDGVEALRFLYREGPYASAPRPHLFIMDLNVPRLDGRRVLAEIKSHSDLKTIPVVILTSSDSAQDIRQSYESHANSFITKPMELEKFIEVVRSIINYWGMTVARPRGD